MSSGEQEVVFGNRKFRKKKKRGRFYPLKGRFYPTKGRFFPTEFSLSLSMESGKRLNRVRADPAAANSWRAAWNSHVSAVQKGEEAASGCALQPGVTQRQHRTDVPWKRWQAGHGLALRWTMAWRPSRTITSSCWRLASRSRRCKLSFGGSKWPGSLSNVSGS